MALLGNLTVGILGDMKGLSSTFKGAQSEVQKFGKRMERVGRDISSVGDTLTRRITMPAIAAASALVGITLVKGFGRLMGIDTARAKLEALGHDAKTVDSIMVSALDSVKGTAFGLDEAATTAANAVAAGIKPGKELTRYLTLTGDAAAIAGADLNDMGAIMNKVQTSNKAYNSELRQLADRGLPIYQWLADEAGTTADAIFDMASKGEISSEMLLNAIEKNIGGAAKTMGEKSFAAAIKNIGADIARIGANFLDAGGEAGGFFSTVKPLLTEFREMLSSVEEKAADWGAKFGEVFNNIIDRIRELKAWFDDLSPSMQDTILKAIGIGAAILVGIGPALKIVGGLISGIGSLISLFGMLATPVGIAVAAVAALIAIGVALWQNWDTIKEKMQPIFEAFAPMIETLKESFQTLMESLAPVGESLKQLFESLMPILQTLGMIIGGVLVAAVGILISLFSALVAAIGPVLNALINLIDVVVNVVNAVLALLQGDWQAALDYWNDATESAVEFFKNLWDGIVNFVMGFVDTIIGFFQGLYDTLVGNSIIPDMVDAIIEWFANMGKWAREKVSEMIAAVIQFFVDMKDRAVQRAQELVQGARDKFEEMKKAASDKVKEMFTAVRNKFNEMREAVQERMQKIRDKIEELWGKAQDFLANIDLKQIGKDIIQGLINGIGSMGSAVWEAAKDIARRVKDSITDFFKMSSPSRLMMSIGGDVGEGLEIGLERSIRAISRTAKKMAQAAMPQLDTMQFAYAMPYFAGRGLDFGQAFEIPKSDSEQPLVQHLNFERMFDGANFYVREEQDIKKIARELGEYINQAGRGRGVTGI